MTKENIEELLKSITGLNVYLSDQTSRAEEARKIYTDTNQEISVVHAEQTHPKYLKGKFESILAPGRNFADSDKAYLECIRDHEKVQTPLSLNHVKPKLIKYWMLACKRIENIHSFMMTGMTINQKHYVTAAFGKDIITSGSYVARKGRIQNEHWLVGFKRDLSFRQKKLEEGAHASYQVSYKGFELSHESYEKLLGQVAIINGAIPVRRLFVNKLRFSSLEDQCLPEEFRDSSKRVEKCDELEKAIGGQYIVVNKTCRETSIEVIEQFAEVADHTIPACGLLSPSDNVLTVDKNGVIPDELELKPIRKSNESDRDQNAMQATHKRWLSQLIALAATSLVLIALHAPLLAYWVLGMAVYSRYQLNQFFHQDPYPKVASVLVSLLMFIQMAGGLWLSPIFCGIQFILLMMVCIYFDSLPHPNFQHIAGFAAMGIAMLMLSFCSFLVPINFAFSSVMILSALSSFVYAASYSLPDMLMPVNLYTSSEEDTSPSTPSVKSEAITLDELGTLRP